MYELRLIAGKRGIKKYKNMSREKLLSTLDESECNLSQNGLVQIAKMQNLSQNELEKIIKILNISQYELEQFANMRRIKSYKNMPKEGLLIALLKPEHSFAELCKNNFNDAKVKEIKSFNELRDRFFRSIAEGNRKEWTISW